MKPPNPYTAIRIKRLRVRQGLNQTEFGRLIGTSRPIIDMIEDGRIPCDDEYIKRICSIFDIEITHFTIEE
jgi:DNA-binding XRE family transcriptional regulator